MTSWSICSVITSALLATAYSLPPKVVLTPLANATFSDVLVKNPNRHRALSATNLSETSSTGHSIEDKLSPPLISPRSGAYQSAIGVTLTHPLREAEIHYTIDGSAPTQLSSSVPANSMLHIAGTYSLSTLLRCFARIPKRPELGHSNEAVAAYEIQMGTYEYERASYTGATGRAYLVPYYHGKNYIDTVPLLPATPGKSNHASKLASVDLNTSRYRTVRLRGVDSDFAEFYTYDSSGGLLYQRGAGPYKGQVRVHDLAAYLGDETMRGFFQGFVHNLVRRNATDQISQNFQYVRRVLVSRASFEKLTKNTPLCAVTRDDAIWRKVKRSALTVESRGFLAPFHNGVHYSGKAIRLHLGRLEQLIQLEETTRNISDCCVVNITEYCTYNSTYVSIGGSVTLESFEYYHNNTDHNLTEALDLTSVDERLRGFVGGFSSGDYAYFVPYFDGENSGHVVARVHAANFTRSSVEYLDLWTVDRTLAGYFSGFAYEIASGGRRYGFLVPHSSVYGPVGGVNTQSPADKRNKFGTNLSRVVTSGDHTVEYFHGKLVRLNLDDFTNASNCIDVLDLTLFDSELRGFAGGLVIGRYGLLIPYKNRADDSGYFGKLVRVDLEDFRIDAVLDLTRLGVTSTTSEISGSALRGFVGGVAWGRYAVLVPHRNGRVNSNLRSHSGVVARIDMEDFSLSGVRALDLATIIRQQVPSTPDNELRGFLFGFSMGDYVYLVPHFARDFYGKLVRIDMRDFDTLAQLQETSVNVEELEPPDIPTSTGIQYLDLEREDRELVGFSGGFAIRSPSGAVALNLSDNILRRAWWNATLQIQSSGESSAEPEKHVTQDYYVASREIVDLCSNWETACMANPRSPSCDCTSLANYDEAHNVPDIANLVSGMAVLQALS